MPYLRAISENLEDKQRIGKLQLMIKDFMLKNS